MKLTDVARYAGIPIPTQTPAPTQSTQPANEVPRIGPKKVLLKWEATPVFMYKQMKPRMKKTFTIIGITIGLLLLLMQEFWLILVVASIFFINHVLSNNPQESFEYELSNWGVSISGTEYGWGNMVHYFLTSSTGEERFAIDLAEGLPARIYLSFHSKDKTKIHEILSNHVPFLKEEPSTAADKFYNSVLSKFDLEDKK